MAGLDGRASGAAVVLFPPPFQGHLSPMLQLAGALHARGFAVTVLHAAHNAPDPAGHPEFTFVAVPDCMPGALAASKDGFAKILAMNAAIEASGCVRDALVSILSEEPRPKCLVIDSTLPASQKAAAQLGLPTLLLQTGSAASSRQFRSYPMLLDKGYLPAQESELHMPVKELPPLRVSDLFDLSKHWNQETANKMLNMSMETIANSSGIVINTFEALEALELEAIRDELATESIGVFAIGPLHKLSSNDTSLLEQDRSCIQWLDTKATGSVLYVSFGSLVVLNQDEFREVAWGLANSGKPFLWVVRRGLVVGSEKPELPDGFEHTVEGRGKVIGWAPQEEVLAHHAVGGFWTHNGWNSTLESIYEGVPMLSRPLFGDQLTTGRYVEEVWRTGFMLEGRLDRGQIEKAITKLMEGEEGSEMRARAKDLKIKAKMCLETDGSTQRAVDKLVNHILSL